MKVLLSILIIFFCSVSFGDQEVYKKDLFKSDIHPFLVKNCSQCHDEKASKPIGPAHSHSNFETAFIEFDKRTRIDKITRSSMWRAGTNGHFCKDHDVQCENLDQITEEWKGLLNKYVADIESAFPKEDNKKQERIEVNGEEIQAIFEVARDIYNRPIKANIKMKRLGSSEYVILKELRITALSGAFFLNGIDFLVNGEKVSKLTGYEEIKRYISFATDEGYFVESFDDSVELYSGKGKIIAPFQPMIRFADNDKLEIKIKSIKQLKEMNSIVCDYFNKPAQSNKDAFFQAQVTKVFDHMLETSQDHYGLTKDEVESSECLSLSQLIDFENPNHSSILLDSSSYFTMVDHSGNVSAKDYIRKMRDLLVNAEFDLKKYSIPKKENVYAELIGNDVFDLAVLDQPELAKGYHLYNIAGCVNCHGKDLSGGLELISPGGNFHVPNISPEPDTGIGRWSLNDFNIAMREGKSPDGTKYFAAFPYTTYRNMTDEDIEAIYNYIMAVKPKYKVIQDHDPSFMASLPFARGIWRAMDSQPDFIKESLSGSDVLSKGAYNALAITHCGECHTPRTNTYHLDYDHWMEGGVVYDNFGNPEKAPSLKNMTSKGWTKENYKNFLRTGVTLGGYADGKMAEVIRNQTSQLNEEEMNNLIEYLISL